MGWGEGWFKKGFLEVVVFDVSVSGCLGISLVVEGREERVLGRGDSVWSKGFRVFGFSNLGLGGGVGVVRNRVG